MGVPTVTLEGGGSVPTVTLEGGGSVPTVTLENAILTARLWTTVEGRWQRHGAG